MKIVSLVAENFKRLKAVSIVPSGSTVLISGANEQGKSSILDALWAAIGGSEMVKSTKTTKPIREGEKSAIVKIDLGDLIVTRKWKSDGESVVSVENKEGAKYGSPQKILDGLVSKIAIDPVSFNNLDDKKQRETLLQMVGLTSKVSELDQFKKGVFESRTDLNRELKHLESQLVAVPEFPSDTPDIEMNTESIMAEQKAMNEQLQKNNVAKNALQSLKTKSESLEVSIESQKEKIADIENELKLEKKKLESWIEELKENKDRVSKGEKHCAELIDPDFNNIESKIKTLDETNKNVRNKKTHGEIVEKIKKISAQVLEKTEKLNQIEIDKKTMLEESKFPITDLSISDDGVLYKGIPFAQCSSAERLRVSVAIAMAMAPKLRVIRISDGSLLDTKNLKVIEEMAKDNDYQVWVEKVDDTGKIGIYIEDGEVKTVN